MHEKSKNYGLIKSQILQVVARILVSVKGSTDVQRNLFGVGDPYSKRPHCKKKILN